MGCCSYVLFMNEEDLAERGLEHGDLVDIETISPSGRDMRLRNITAIAHDIARGSIDAYYPEANCLVPLDYVDAESGTPSYKSVPVRVTRATSVTESAV
jgi:anaerobic selenocysteine-containing dehydrogenase